MAEVRDIEPLLQVGLLAYICPHTDKREGLRVPAVVRGWQRESYILIDAPPSGDRLPPVTPGQACTVRFLSEGQACGFETQVIGWEGSGFVHLRIGWPSSIQSMPVRKFERAQMLLACRVAIPGSQEMKGILCDLSTNGCGVRCDGPRGFIEGEAIVLTFTLPNGCPVTNAVASVRNIRISAQSTILGLEFVKLTDAERFDIELFLSGVFEARQTQRTDGRRILVFDRDSGRIQELTEGFRPHEYEILIVQCLVDCLYRLRVGLPSALMVNAGDAELPLYDLCQILRRTRGLDRLPIFVYGMTDAQAAEQVQKDGLAVVLPSHLSVPLIVESLAPRPETVGESVADIAS